MQKAMSDYDVTVAIAATAGLRRAGDIAASNIAQLLSHPSPAVRARAAEAAGGMRSTALASRALTDTDAMVRARAVESLGDILARSARIRADLLALTTAQDTDSQEKAFQALQTHGAVLELGQPANATARANAIAYLNTKVSAQTDEGKKKPFIDLIARINTPQAVLAPLTDVTPATIAPLTRALADTDGNVAQNAVIALARIGSTAIGPLTALLSNSNETVAYYASQALAEIGRPAVEALLPAAEVGKPTARWAAITLGEIGDGRATNVLQALSQSPDPDTAYAAGAALAKVRGT
jgi:HEAT repeat protein